MDDVEESADVEAVTEDAVITKRLVYSGPSAKLVYAGIEFPNGVPVAADAGLAAEFAEHSLAAEGHSLTIVE